jgi:hypothetical protein
MLSATRPTDTSAQVSQILDSRASDVVCISRGMVEGHASETFWRAMQLRSTRPDGSNPLVTTYGPRYCVNHVNAPSLLEISTSTLIRCPVDVSSTTQE